MAEIYGGHIVARYLKEIENAGFITIKLSGKGHLGTTQLISLPDIPAEIASDKVKDLLD